MLEEGQTPAALGPGGLENCLVRCLRPNAGVCHAKRERQHQTNKRLISGIDRKFSPNRNFFE